MLRWVWKHLWGEVSSLLISFGYSTRLPIGGWAGALVASATLPLLASSFRNILTQVPFWPNIKPFKVHRWCLLLTVPYELRCSCFITTGLFDFSERLLRYNSKLVLADVPISDRYCSSSVERRYWGLKDLRLLSFSLHKSSWHPNSLWDFPVDFVLLRTGWSQVITLAGLQGHLC